MKIMIINGPNLNLLGTREPHIYGNRAFEKYFGMLDEAFEDVELAYFQSNVEGELINKMHEVRESVEGIILNAGAYAHTSLALADCLQAIEVPVIEVHISNVFARESFRQQLVMAPYTAGFISGFGLESYRLAIESFRDQLR